MLCDRYGCGKETKGTKGKNLLSNVGKIQKSSVKSGDLMLWKHGKKTRG